MAFGGSSIAQISCSGACSSSSRACISSSGQRLQSLEAPEALSLSRGITFSPSGATTLPHINYACQSHHHHHLRHNHHNGHIIITPTIIIIILITTSFQ